MKYGYAQHRQQIVDKYDANVARQRAMRIARLECQAGVQEKVGTQASDKADVGSKEVMHPRHVQELHQANVDYRAGDAHQDIDDELM